MRIIILCGSNRQNSTSERISRFVEHQLRNSFPQEELDVSILQPTQTSLPLWEESIYEAGSDLQAKWAPFSEQLQQADAFVILTPEWNGMVPSVLKNFLLFCGAKELAHKPALLIAVSSGMGGVLPLVELRTTAFKNNKVCYIPEQVVVRDATKMCLDFDHPKDERDASVHGRIRFVLGVLLAYGKALGEMRKSTILHHPDYPFGM